ncbi:MAG: hypothetical protein NTX97_12055 [Bacteroidetes bacterium]|nr:hypothetical protein [Bacteroidota bacterium]
MKNQYPFIFLLLFLPFSKPEFPQKSVSDWQLQKFENGITVYSRIAENSKYKELKVVYQIKTSLSSIVALLNDAPSFPQWVYRCDASKILKKDSDKHLIRYQTVAAPWPVDDRDMVVDVNTFQDPKTKIVYQKVTCIPDFIPEDKDHIRIREFRGSWTLKPLKNGIVELEYELLVNPGGIVPAWIINMAIVDGPFDTSMNMKVWVMKDKYQKTNYPFIVNP